MSEFIEIISPSAKAELEAIMPLVNTLANKIKEINNFKASGTPSGSDKNIKGMTDAYKGQTSELEQIRKRLEMIASLNKQRYQEEAKLIADHDKALIYQSEKELKQIRDRQAMIASLGKQRQAEEIKTNALIEKLAQETDQKERKRLKGLVDFRAAMFQQRIKEEDKLQRELEKTQAKEAKWSRTGSSSVIPGMSQKISDLKETEKSVLANEKLNRAYVQLTANREKAKQKLQDYIAEETRSTAEIRKAQKEFDVLNKKVAAADKAVGKFSEANRSINGLSRSVGNLMTAFGVGTGLYLAVDIAKSIYTTTKALQSLDLALKMVSGTQEEFANNQSFLRNLAEQYGIEIKGLTKNFTEFWVASKGKLEAEQIKEIFTSISKSVAVMGLSVEQQDSAFLALQQMMSKGTVQAEELKKQLGNALPGAVKAATMAYQALHPEMKVTEKYFMEQMKAGKVLSAELLPELAKAYEKLYGIENVKRAETLQASQERLQNSWTELVRSMNESKTGGISSFFSFVFEGLTNGIRLLTRFNSSWDELYKRASDRGKKLGSDVFTERMNNVGFATSTRADKANMVLDVARKEFLILKEQEKKVNSYLDKAIVKFGSGYEGLKKQKEQLILDIAARAEIMKLAKIELQPKKQNKDKDSKTETEAERKKREANEKKLDEQRLKSIEEYNKDLYDLKMSNLEVQKQLAEDEIDLANAITQNKEIQYEDVIDATKYYNGVLLAIEKAKYDEEVRLAKDNSKEKEIAYNKWFVTVLKLSKENSESLLKVTKDFAKKENEIAKKMLSDIEENAKAFEEIDKRMTGAKADNYRDSLKANVKIFNEFAGDFANKSGFSQTFDNFFKENKDGVSLFDSLIDPDSAMDAEERTKATLLVISSAFQDTLSLIDDAESQRHQRKLDRLEEEKDIALRFAGESASAKAKIEEDYDKRKKALQVKEFKRKQKMALANIAIDTAQAVMAVSGQGQPWLVPAMIALGLIQSGMVLAQKPPEYWTGTDDAEAGLAWTQERGAEIVTDKRGNIKDFGDNKGARLTMMEKGDKVYTAQETKRLMFDNELNSIMMNNGISNSPKIVVNSGMSKSDMKEVMLETLGSMPMQSTIIDRNGLQHIVSNGYSKTIYNSNRVSGLGIRV
jgi:tape measure domain-containing protein